MDNQAASYVVPYMEERVALIDEAWNPSGFTWDDKIQRWDASDGLKASSELFKKVIAEYSETAKMPLQKFDIRSTHTWDEVQVVAAEAVAKYNSKDKGLKGIFHKTGRALSKASPGHQGWIQTLPCGDYASVVCGALKLVFGAAAKMSDIRGKVLRGLDCLPDTEIPELYLREYQDNKQLSLAAEELYMSILEAIVGMLTWLDGNSYKKTLQALGLQGHYGNEIESSLEVVREKSKKFKEVANFCGVHRLGNVERRQILAGRAMCHGFVNQASLSKALQEDTVNSIKDFLYDCFEANIDRTVERVKASIAIEQATIISAAAIQQADERPTATWDQMLGPLQKEVDVVKRDLEFSIAQGNVLKLPDQQRAAYLAKNQQFQSWLQSDSSEMLFIEGMGENVIVSAMSYFCAMFSQELPKFNNVVPLSFFCGRASQRADKLSQTSVLMRSLNSQLLVNSLFSLEDVSRLSRSISNLNNSSLEDLRDLFSQLIAKIHSSAVVVIVIDGIYWIEKSISGSKEMSETAKWLRDLIEAPTHVTTGDGAKLKLLVTSPKDSRDVKRVFPKEKRLSLPAQIRGNGLTLTQIQMRQKRLKSNASDGSNSNEISSLFESVASPLPSPGR